MYYLYYVILLYQLFGPENIYLFIYTHVIV